MLHLIEPIVASYYKILGLFDNFKVSSRTITFEIRPKLEALDPKYYREIQQSKLDRTVARQLNRHAVCPFPIG